MGPSLRRGRVRQKARVRHALTLEDQEAFCPQPEGSTVSFHDQAMLANVENHFERRLAPRVAIHLDLELRLDETPSGLRARSCDISTGGMCVETPGPFVLASLRMVSVQLPDGVMILTVKGCSQRIDSLGVAHLTGIQFTDASQMQRQRLWEIVQGQAVNLARFLEYSPDLPDLDLDETMELVRTTRLREIPRARKVYSEGSWRPGEDSVFIVAYGTVVLEARAHRSRDIWLERVGPRGLFGGLPLIARVPHVESATAEADLQLVEIDRFSFEYMEWVRPQIARAVARAVARKQVRHLHSLIERLADAC